MLKIKMPNKRKICTENLNTNQSIYIASLNSYYPPESVINSAYRKVLDFKENAEKILEKEKSETLCLSEFSKAILDSRSFEISLQHNCIKLKCYITLEKDKDAKKKRNEQLQQQNINQTPPSTPPSTQNDQMIFDSSYTTNKMPNSSTSGSISNASGGAKKVNVEVIMKSNPFRVEENEKTTRMELIRSNSDSSMLRFTYFVKPECEAKKFRDTSGEFFDKSRLVVFTNDFFTVYQDSTSGEMNISLNEIVQTPEEQKRTEALGEKLFALLKDRPRHRALLTNECKLNHAIASNYLLNNFEQNNSAAPIISLTPPPSQTSPMILSTQEDETYYTRELIHIYGQPIVPSFHKHFNYQLSNTHYGYRTLRRLLNCDILKNYVKITKEEIKSLERVVEFVQLTTEKCLSAFQLNITTFYDPTRFENGIVKNWLDVWYVDRLKEKYASSNDINNTNNSNVNNTLIVNISSVSSSWSNFNPNSINFFTSGSKSASSNSCFLHTSNCCNSDDSGIINDENTNNIESECDQANHLWFCLKDYQCAKMEQFITKLSDYITIRNNKSELILVHTAHPIFEYKDVLTETRRILAMFLNKSTINKTIDEIILKKFPFVARQLIENLLNKFLNFDTEKKVCGFTALFEILMILKRELNKEKNDEMKYSHFLCTLERANQEKLKLAIIQLKCVPCLNKFTTNFNLLNANQSNTSSTTSCNNTQSGSNASSFSHANMSRLLKQMSLIVSTELQQIAIDLIERIDDEKPVKYIKLKEEFRVHNSNNNSNSSTTNSSNSSSQASSGMSSTQQSSNTLLMKQQQQINNLMQMKNLAASFAKKVDLSSNTNSTSNTNTTKPQSIPQIFNPHSNLQQFISHEQKVQDISNIFGPTLDCSNTQLIYSDRY